MTKEEYLTGSDISNYCVTTAYLQDTSEMILRDLAEGVQGELRRRGFSEIETEKQPIKTEISNKGTELVSLGRVETKDEYLLDILKENGFYLMYTKKETKFGEYEYYQILYSVT